MNKIITLLFCCLLYTSLTAQDKHFKFDQPYYKLENKYVIVQEKNQDGAYIYGLGYLDNAQGFKFVLMGSFTMDAAGKATNTHDGKFKSYPFPIGYLVAPLPDKLYKQFGLAEYSGLEENYDADMKTEVVKDIVKRGIWYVKAGGYEEGISILLKAYAKDPHAENLEMFLGRAYIDTKQYDKATDLLRKALLHDLKQYICWQFFGEAYHKKGNYAEGDKAFKKAIEVAPEDYKKELGYMVANFYSEKKDKQRFAEWVKIARQYLSDGDSYLDSLEYMERKLNE